MHEAITLDEIRKRGIELPKDVYTFPVDEFENHRMELHGIGGVYTFTHSTEGYLYVGISKRVESRLIMHINGTKKGNRELHEKLKELKGTIVTIFKEQDESLREFYENYLILKYSPQYNKAKRSKITDGFPTPTHEYSKEIQDEVVALYKDNVTIQQIEKITGLKRYSQRSILKRHGVQRTQKPPEQRRSRNNEIIRLRDEGWKREDIARELSVSQSTIANIVYKHRVAKGESEPKRSKSHIEKRNEEILKGADDGMSIQQISESFEISETYVSAILTRNGVRRQAELGKIIKERNKEIMRLYTKEGWTQVEIGKKFDLRQGSVGNIISSCRPKNEENKFDKRRKDVKQ